MSQISRIKTWTAEVLYSSDLNAEFNNILNYWNGADAASNAWTSLAVTNNATIGGTLSVTGTTTLGTVNISGTGTIGTLAVTGNGTVTGTLGVTGNGTVTGTLGVTGVTTLGTANITTGNISGTGTIGTLAVTGNGTVTGTFNVTGAVNFSSTLGVVGAISIAATSNQFIIGSARTVTISAPTPASASRVWTIPDISTDGTFASLTGTQTFSGAKTFSADTTFSSATSTAINLAASASGAAVGQIISNTSNTASATALLQVKVAGTTAADPYTHYTVTGATDFVAGIDNSASDAFVISRGTALGTNNAISISATTSAVEIQGSTTNDSAAAGKVGEYKEAIGSATALTTLTYSDGGNAGLNLTPGDWDVWAICVFSAAVSTTVAYVYGFIGTAPGNSSTGSDGDRNSVQLGYGSPGIVPVYDIFVVTPCYRVSISSNTTYYPKLLSSFTTSTMNGKGNIFARRVR